MHHITYAIYLKENKKLLKRFYKANHYSASFMGLDHTYVVSLNNTIIGCVILSYLDKTNTIAFLHALFISPIHRHKGYAHCLIEYACKHHEQIICFADSSLDQLYTKSKFIEGSIEKLPAVILKRFTTYLSKHKNLRIYFRSNR